MTFIPKIKRATDPPRARSEPPEAEAKARGAPAGMPPFLARQLSPPAVAEPSKTGASAVTPAAAQPLAPSPDVAPSPAASGQQPPAQPVVVHWIDSAPWMFFV